MIEDDLLIVYEEVPPRIHFLDEEAGITLLSRSRKMWLDSAIECNYSVNEIQCRSEILRSEAR
jgi:hypothetical protein